MTSNRKTPTRSDIVSWIHFETCDPGFVRCPHLFFRRETVSFRDLSSVAYGMPAIWGVPPPFLADGRDALAFLDDDPPFSNWLLKSNQRVVGDYLNCMSGSFYDCYGIFVNGEIDKSRYEGVVPLRTSTLFEVKASDERAGHMTLDGPAELEFVGIWDRVPSVVAISGWTIVPDSHGNYFVLACVEEESVALERLRDQLIGDGVDVSWLERGDEGVVCKGGLEAFDLEAVDDRIRQAAEKALKMNG